MNYILELGNPFEYEKEELVNVVDQTKLSEELGQQIYADFYQSGLVQKSVKLLIIYIIYQRQEKEQNLKVE